MLVPVGIALFALGLIGFVYGVFQRVKAGRITDAPLVSTGDLANRGRAVAGSKGQVSAQGNVACHQPVIAPFSGVSCLYYEIKCTARWKDGDAHKSKVIDEQKVAASFTIDDGSGPIAVDAREGGDFEPTQRKSETKGTGLIGGITGADLEFGGYRVNTPILDVGTKYEVEELVLPMVPRLYACGRVADLGNAIASPSWRQLLLSSKTRDELLASATKTSKLALLAGGALLLVGGGTATAGTMMAEKPTAAAASAMVVTTEPVLASPPPSLSLSPSASASTPAPSAATSAPPSSASASAAASAAAATPKGKGKGKKSKKKP